MNGIKKTLALLLALALLAGMTACGGDKPAQEPPKAENTEQNTATETTEATEPEPGLTIHENVFFTVGYDEEAGWSLAEDDYYLSDYGGNVYLRILDDDGYTEVLVEIEAYETDAEGFRDSLFFGGFDEKEYASGNLETVDIGGQAMLCQETGSTGRIFFGRNEAAGVTYEIDTDDWDDPRVPELIEHITCTASGTDNIDPPWYWEGEPFSGSTRSRMMGKHTLTAEFLPMDVPMVTHETFAHDIALVEDQLYVLTACQLYRFDFDGASLKLDQQIPLDGEYEFVETGADGELILSAFMEPVLGHDGDSPVYAYDGPDCLCVAPGGEWGISWFVSGEDCEKYTFQGDALVSQAFPFPEVDVIAHVSIDERYIFVSGSSAEDDEHYVFVYDHSGQLKLQLGGEPNDWGLGSVTYAVSTDNGFLALDGNMREVVLWTPDGTWIGAVDDGDLFGTGYPWMANATQMEDGSILVVMCDERADESADEVLVFRLSGF